jgi:hypothetical protein
MDISNVDNFRFTGHSSDELLRYCRTINLDSPPSRERNSLPRPMSGLVLAIVSPKMATEIMQANAKLNYNCPELMRRFLKPITWT